MFLNALWRCRRPQSVAAGDGEGGSRPLNKTQRRVRGTVDRTSEIVKQKGEEAKVDLEHTKEKIEEMQHSLVNVQVRLALEAGTNRSECEAAARH